MIETGLPFDFEDMDKIANEGAVIDMSQTNYPIFNDEDVTRITFIYLRNTNFSNVILDFSKVDYLIKEKYLINYLYGDIEYSIRELSESLVKLLAKYKGMNLNINSILTNEEENKFILNNEKLLNELDIFTYSLPLYSIYRLKTEDFKFDFSDIEKSSIKFNSNICSLIEHPCWNLFYELQPTFMPKFYENMFTDNNNKLFETIMKYTPFSILLYGMSNEKEWKEFATMIKEYKEETYD